MRFAGTLVFHLLIFIAVCLLLLSSGSPAADLELWPGWYTLVTGDAGPVEEALAGEVELLSPNTLDIRLNGFGTELRIPLARVEERLSPLDPRIDPFVRALPRLFEGRWNDGEARILYIERSVSDERIDEILAAAGIPSGNYLIADRVRGAILYPMLLFGAAAALTVLLRTRRRILSVLVLLPWGLGIGVAGGAGIYLSLLALFIVPRLLDLLLPALLRRCHRPETEIDAGTRFEAGVLGLGLIIGMAVYGGFASFADFLRFPFSAALASLSLVRARILIEERRAARLLHPLFFPVALVPAPRRGGRTVLAALVAAAAMAATLAAPAGSVPAALELPLPAAVEAVDGDLETTLARLAEYEEGGLPGLPLYLTHRYFQENYLYAPAFELPPLNGGIDQERYSRHNGRIAADTDTIWRFTYGWYTAIIEDDTDRIHHFFIHDGVPGGVRRSAISAASVPTYGLIPGLGLLFSLAAVTLLRIFRHYASQRGKRRFDSRRIGETA